MTQGRRGEKKHSVTIQLCDEPDYHERLKTLAWRKRIAMGELVERWIEREWKKAEKGGKV